MAKTSTFGRVLKALRKERGLTRYRLAKRTGLTAQALRYLETTTRDPAWSTIRRLVRALGVPYEAFDVGPLEGMPSPSGSQGKPLSEEGKKPGRSKKSE